MCVPIFLQKFSLGRELFLSPTLNIIQPIKSTIKEKDSHKEKRQHQGYYMYPRCCRINFGFYSSTLVDKEPKILSLLKYLLYFYNDFLSLLVSFFLIVLLFFYIVFLLHLFFLHTRSRYLYDIVLPLQLLFYLK